jgi:DNA-binding LytR/AlgR family response regulator
MFTCLIVDDELIARRGVEKYISKIGFLTVAGSVRTAIEAHAFLKANDVDIMVLDIQMPQLNGLDFLKSLANPPVTVIITAYPGYALRGFELDVIDYVVKPVSFERFLKALNKAKEYLELKKNHTTASQRNHLFVKSDGRIEKIFLDDILFIEAKENYSSIHTRSGKYLVLINLKNLEASLDENMFMRVHKSFIVSINNITAVEGHTIFIGNNKIALARHARQALLAAWRKSG